MSSFTGFDAGLYTYYDADASKKLGIDHWRVTKAFGYYFDREGSPWSVSVERGFLTDGASVPRVFWNIIPPWGAYGQAAVLHDALCERLTLSNNGNPQPITRKQADQALLEMMTVLNVPKWKRETIYAAVRLYATVSHVDKPSGTPLKTQLEAEWLEQNPL